MSETLKIQKTSDGLKIGIDLGSSKTAVMSSTGRRAMIPSAVGRPRDSVSRKLFDTSVILGDAILQHPHALNVVRPLSHGQIKYLNTEDVQNDPRRAEECSTALQQILGHALAQIGVEPGTSAFCVLGVPSRASFQSQEFIVQAAERCCRPVIVVSEPFAVAYGMGQLTDALVIDIGAGTIDICPLTGSYPSPEHQVTLPLGGDSVDEAFYQAILDEYPTARFTLEQVRDVKERHGSIGKDLEQVTLTLVVDGRPRPVNVVEPLRRACERFVEPIGEGIAECLSWWDHESQGRLLGNVILAGGGSRVVGLEAALEKTLKDWYGRARVTRVHDSMYAGAAGALKLAMDMPSHQWEAFREAA